MNAAPFRQRRLILFDLDGTLVDSAPDLAAAADKMRTDRNMPSLPFSDYRVMAGAGAPGLLSVAFGLTPQSPDYAAMREEFLNNYEACMTQRSAVFDGVAGMVQRLLDAGLRWGVVTNKIERFTLPMLRSLALFDSAAVIVGGDTTPHLKPHPAPLLEAMRRAGIGAGESLYVGDDERDVLAARAACMPAVAATYGYLGQKPVEEWKADAVIHSPLMLLPLLGL